METRQVGTRFPNFEVRILAHVQPAGFVLRPDGTIALAVCSSGKVGRR